jgi:hypothetical protein
MSGTVVSVVSLPWEIKFRRRRRRLLAVFLMRPSSTTLVYPPIRCWLLAPAPLCTRHPPALRHTAKLKELWEDDLDFNVHAILGEDDIRAGPQRRQVVEVDQHSCRSHLLPRRHPNPEDDVARGLIPRRD